jgi:hypothetical protein
MSLCWGHVGDENKKTSEYQRFMFKEVVLQGQEPA